MLARMLTFVCGGSKGRQAQLCTVPPYKRHVVVLWALTQVSCCCQPAGGGLIGLTSSQRHTYLRPKESYDPNQSFGAAGSGWPATHSVS
jgi:hypothetical protein